MRRLSGTKLYAVRHHLKKGGVLVYPAESCFGVGGLPFHTKALRHILRIKKRPMNKGMIVVGGKIEQLQSLTLFRQPENWFYLKKEWQQSSTTFLLPANKMRVKPALRGAGRSNIGVRLPLHTGLQNLCRDLRTALVSTSANKSHGKPCRNEREAKRLFGKKAMTISGKIGKNRKPSKIIDWQSGEVVR
ncbi:MAG: L-threonylcarbamoyladenylate synthase [Neisseriaceae bacterium]|nr:L-threonylcarbamoyladenylate synthase [Neisseriaceae bacterium]